MSSGTTSIPGDAGVTNRLSIPKTLPSSTNWLWWYPDYGYNVVGVGHDGCGLYTNPTDYSELQPLRPGQAGAPSDLIAFADAARTNGDQKDYGTMFAVDTGLSAHGIGDRGWIRDRHAGSGNVVLIDGHAETMRDPRNTVHPSGTNFESHVTKPSHKYFCRKSIRK